LKLKKDLKQTARVILFLSLAILLLWVSFRGVKFNDLWESLKKADYWWLLLSVSMAVFSFFIRARRWTLLIEPLGYKPRLINTYHSVVTGYFANLLFPRLGEITKCAALGEKEKIPFDKLVGTIIIERTIDILTVLVLLGLTLIAGSTTTGSFLSGNVFTPLSQKLSSSFGSAALFYVMIIALIVLVIILYFVLRKKLSARPFFKKIYSFTDGIIDGIKSISKLKRKWEFLFQTILLWVVYLFMTYFPLLCLESTKELGLSGGMFILVIGSFGMAAPVQSGLGAYHWIVSRGLLVAYGIPLSEGLAYATLSHESQLLIVAIFGAISFFVLFGRKGGKVFSSAGKIKNA
jgi:glycosyltransferase 2 family protein